MGKINTYQRRQLASSVVGTPAQDTSGQIVGKSIVNLGAALIKRQNALDVAETTKQYYRYVAENSLETAQIQKTYLSDPNLDPLSFNEKYAASSQALAQTYKEKMPERLHGKFDVLVERQGASQTIKNNRWVLEQQNRNALIGFNDLGNEFNILASETTNAVDFMDLVTEYDDGSNQFRPIATASSFKSTTNTHKKNIALSHLNSRMDIDNNGNPLALWQELGDNKEYRQALSKALGETTLQGIEKRLDKAIANMGVEQGFRKLMADDASLIETTDKIFSQDNGFGLSEVENLRQMEKNFLTSLKNSNVKGVNDAQITQSENAIAVYDDLVDIARYTNDTSYPTTPGAKAELTAEINNMLLPYGGKTSKTGKAVAGARKDISGQQESGKTRISPFGFLGRIQAQGVTRFILDRVTGIPRSVRAEQGEDVKADKTLTEYMQGMYAVKGKILAARREKKINSRDAQTLIAKFVAPLSTLNNYDTVTNTGKNWFTEGYNAFGGYVKNLPLRGTAEANRATRDVIQTQMMTRLAEQVSILGGMSPADDFVTNAIANIKFGMSKSRNPAFGGAKPGDYVEVDGRAVEFVTFDQTNGAPIIKTIEGLQEAVDNT